MERQTIPIAKPSLTKKERKYLIEAYDTGFISAFGKFITRFEEEFRAYIGSDYATSCNSGTSALHLALIALGIGRDCEVIIPSLTFQATKNAVIYQKAIPVVVDVDPETLCIDTDRIESLICRKTKAIIAVHLYGNPCNMEKLLKICTDRKIHLIEDCAESVGSMYGNKMCGTFGTLSCFSFYGNKTMTTGQGGMILSPSKELINVISYFKNQAMVRPYHHIGLGYNYRITNIEAAIGLAQLERIDDIIDMKLHITEFYRDNLDATFQKSYDNSDPVLWMNTVECKSVEERESLVDHLTIKGIETRPCFDSMEIYKRVADDKAGKVLCLPSGPNITDDELRYVVEAIDGYYRTHRQYDQDSVRIS
jgi:perosamine synthetase